MQSVLRLLRTEERKGLSGKEWWGTVWFESNDFNFTLSQDMKESKIYSTTPDIIKASIEQ